MSTFAWVIGLAAAVCTTAANLPQIKKAWTTGQTDDISLKMLLLFACGLALWVLYGVLQKDIIIILANGVGLALLAALMYLKLRQTPPKCAGWLRQRDVSSEKLVGRTGCSVSARPAHAWMNARSSSLTRSLRVVQMPCGAPS